MSVPSLRSELRALGRLAWPIMGAQVLQTSMTFADNVMVGALGHEALAGLALAATAYNLVLIFGIGLVSAVGPLVSQAFGAGDRDRAAVLLGHGLAVAGFCSLLAAGVLLAAPQALLALGQDPRIVSVAADYLRMILFAYPFAVGFLALRQFTEGISRTRASFVFAATGALANVALNAVLVTGRAGFPRLGVTGSALATVVASACMFLGQAGYVLLRGNLAEFNVRANLGRWHRELFKNIFRLGFPLAGLYVAEFSLFGSATLLVGTMGDVPLAAHQIALNLASLTFMMPLGLSFATSIRVGQASGRGDLSAVRRAAAAGLLAATMVMSASATVFWLYPEHLAHLYTREPFVVGLAVRLLGIAAIFQIFDGLQVVGSGILKGLRDTAIPFMVALLAYVFLGIGLAAWLGRVRGLGPFGVWIALATSLAVTAACHHLRYRWVLRRQG
jgi:MATE family multidrug resistance protein